MEVYFYARLELRPLILKKTEKVQMAETPKKLKKHHVREIRDKIKKNRNVISSALDYLSEDSFWFCYVKIIFCDAAYPSSFTQAACFTKRNIDEQTKFLKTYTSFTDLFSCKIVQSFVDNDKVEELTDCQLEALTRLADFFENIKGTYTLLTVTMYTG